FTAPEEVYTAEPYISTSNVPVSTVGAEVSTAAESLVYIRRSAAKRNDKEASTFKPKEWDKMQAQIEADEEVAHRLQAQERERYSEANKAKFLVKLINERKRQFVQQRAQQRRNKPLAQASQRSSKRSGEEELGEESSKRQKIGEGPEPAKRSKDKESNEQDDLVNLWDLVRERFSSTEPTDDKERALWVKLKRLFKPDTDDLLELQRYMHDPLTWRLYDTCGVNHVSTKTGLDIFMLVEKDYPMRRGLLMLMLVNKLQVNQHSEMADEILRKIFILANRPRH
ncbi:hypothetical protein Tco_0735387, partial [Tanacetum coccineum]